MMGLEKCDGHFKTFNYHYSGMDKMATGNMKRDEDQPGSPSKFEISWGQNDTATVPHGWFHGGQEFFQPDLLTYQISRLLEGECIESGQQKCLI